MIKILLSIFALSMMLGCNRNIRSLEASSQEDTTTYQTIFTGISEKVPYYQSDEYFPFSTDLNTSSIDSLYPFLTYTKEPITNSHDSSVVDTIYNYSYQQDEIKIYKSAYGDYLSLYNVTDTIFKLAGNIKVGISKDYFSKKFNIDRNVDDTVDVGNLEQTFIVRFYFKNDKLQRIKIEPYLD